jgi:hypothetical protein
MGGGQSLNFGLAHLDTFAWVGAFSSAPNTKPPAELVPDPAKAKENLKLLWIAYGKKDGLIRLSRGVHAVMKEKDVPHAWHMDGNAHGRRGEEQSVALCSAHFSLKSCSSREVETWEVGTYRVVVSCSTLWGRWPPRGCRPGMRGSSWPRSRKARPGNRRPMIASSWASSASAAQ